MKRAFLLDNSSFQYRAYHASKERPTYNKEGVPNAAVNLYRTMIARLLKEWHPDYLAACCDSQAENFRVKLYPLYKATRLSPPEEYLRQLPGFRALLHAEFIPIIEKDGFEADDIIGTLAAHIDGPVTIVSGDKDMAQLVTEDGRVTLLNTNTNRLLNADGVREVYGISPGEVVDYLAMVGDTSDNVPGAHGLGPKGAVALLRRFGTLDEIIKRSGEIKEKGWRHAIEDNLPMLHLSRQLVKINTNVEGVYECTDGRNHEGQLAF